MKTIRKLLITAAMALLLTMLLSTSAFAATGEATVNSHMLNVREGAGMEYLIIDVAYEGNDILVTEDLGNGWVKVSFNGQTGYVNALFLTFKPVVASTTYTAPAAAQSTAAAPAAAAPAAVTAAVTGNTNAVISGDGVYLRSGPSLNSEVVDVLYKGSAIQVNGATGAWYEVVYNGQTGYVYGDFVNRTGVTATFTVTAPAQSAPAAAQTTEAAPAATPAPAAPAATPAPAATAAPAAASATGQAIVNTAMKYQGIRYLWGGTSPETGFDCSGLVYYVYKQHGITLNRVAQSMYYNGTAADLSALQPGDVLLFGSSVHNIWHAGLYVGNGQFIHSPHSGAVVTVQSLSELYGYRLVAARRIV